MKNMKKILSFLLVLGMVLSYVPMPALAAEGEPCSVTEGCEGTYNAEGICTVCNLAQPVVLTITAWSWNDENDILSEDGTYATLPNAADWETLKSVLPAAITAMVDGAEVEIPVQWECETFPTEGEGQGTYELKAILPEGYVLGDGVTVLKLEVDLGVADQLADGTTWDGTTVADDFAGGNGEKDTPYIIATAGQLIYLRNQVNGGQSYDGKYFQLNADLDMASISFGNSIGYINSSYKFYYFNGHFDGNGHKISNLKIENSNGYSALFGNVGFNNQEVVIKNLTLVNVNVNRTATNYGAAALVGQPRYAKIENCTVESGTVETNASYAGGLVASLNTNPGTYGLTIINCVNHASVTNKDNSIGSTPFTGGILGNGNGAKITGCTNYGTITTNKYYAGGIAGRSHRATIEKCANYGAVSSTNGSASGILADGGNEVVKNCYNRGNITAKEYATGISVGFGSTSGHVDTDTIINCYSVGTLTGTKGSHAISKKGSYPNSCTLNNNYSLTDGDAYVTQMTAAEFANGTVYKLLQGANTEQVWGQTIDEDAYPVFYNGSNKPNLPVAVTGVTLSQETLSLNVGESATLTATVVPADASNQGVIWKSSDTTVATVDENGRVTAMAAGTTTITVTTVDGGHTDTCVVTVHAHSWTYTKENNTTISASCDCSTSGGTVSIAVPESVAYTGNAIEAKVTNNLTTGDTVTVVYSGEGLEDKPVNPGTYTATITLDDAEISVTYTIVDVLNGITVTADSTGSVAVPTKGKSQTVTLTAMANYAYGENANVTEDATWTLEGTYTGVSIEGNVITLAPEAAAGTIKATATYGGESKEIEITLTKANAGVLDELGEIEGDDEISVTGKTEPQTGTYTITGEDIYGAEVTPTVTWSVTDYEGVTIAANGELTVPVNVPNGTKLTITATSGTLSKTKEVTVISHVHSWTYSVNDAEDTITATCSNEDNGCSNTNGGSVTLIAPDSITYNGQSQGATIEGSFIEGTPTVSYQYKATEGDVYGAPKDDFVSAGFYKVTMTAPDGTTAVSVEYEIQKRIVTITANNQNITYGGSIVSDTAQVTTENLVEGHTLGGITLTTEDTNVTTNGTITPSAATIHDGNSRDVTANYAITYQNGKLIINKATTSVAFKADYDPSKDYNGQPISNPTADQLTISGTAYSDVTFTWYKDSVAEANKLTAAPKDAGTYYVVASIAETANTTASNTTSNAITIGKLDISNATITLGTPLTYTGKVQTQTVSEVKVGDVVVDDYTISGNTGTAVTSYTLTIKGEGNFTGTKEAEWNIGKADASIVWNSGYSNSYGANMYITSYINGVDGKMITGTAVATVYDANGNALNSVTCTKTEASGTYYYNNLNQLSDGTYLAPGTYTVRVTFEGNDNYLAKTVELVEYTINKRALTVAANNNTITYGDVPAANGFTVSGFVGNENTDVLDGKLTYSFGYERYGKVGSYKITPAGLTSDNYEITFVPGTLTVKPKAIIITADAVSKTYGDTDPTLTYEVIGLVNGDELTGTLARVEGENVGSYNITIGTLGNDNYNITFNGAKLTINAKTITKADVKLNGSLTYNGKAQTQPITVTEGITYEVTGNKATNAGEYELTVTGTGNYTGSVNMKWSIAKAAVTITADNKVIYIGEELPSLTYTVSGLMDGDKLDKEPVLTTNADADQAGSHTITAANADAGDNYTITYVNGSLTIMDKETAVKARIEITELTAVPDGLKNTEFNTVESIAEEMISRILATSNGFAAENMEHYDVTLQFSLDGGDTWFLATEENFPTEGITVTLPYPEGTNPRDYEFVVSHMFTVTSQRLGTTTGDVELPKVEETANGIRVTLNGLSPVTVAARYHDHTGGTATCTDKAVCSICGNAYGELNSTNHAGGTEVKDAKEATCGAEGYTGDTCCKGCGEVVEKGTTIKATGEHTYGDWKVVKEPTKTTKGEKQRTCDLCGHVDTKEIPVLSDTPATGDDSNIMLYGSIFTVSLAALIVLLPASKKRKQENA